MSSAKERRQAKKAARQDRRGKVAFEAAGLTWSSNPDVRTAGLFGGFETLEDFGLLVAKSGAKSAAAAIASAVINPVAGLAVVLSITKDVKDAFSLFQRGYNRAVQVAAREMTRQERAQQRSPETTTERPSGKQVDIGTVGSKLPAQTIGMMKPTADPEAWKAWVVPAIGLAAAFILWRRS